MIEISILKTEPFALRQSQKEAVFLPEIKKAAIWHYQNCPEFKNLCDNRKFDPFLDFNLADLPYFPVSIFKKFDLLSVPKKEIIKTLYSSSTSGQPSKIMLDKATADYQAIAINKIMSDFLGKTRRNFIIFDNEKTVQTVNGELSSRGTAIRGLLSFARKTCFVLDENLKLDIERLKLLAEQIPCGEKICFFGFTWILYRLYLENKENGQVKDIFKKFLSGDKIILHIGGWKKIKDLAVSKDDFNRQISGLAEVKIGKIIDFYGMTEQLGTVYPDCECGYKHIPVYSEIIIRDIDTLAPLSAGKTGFIQFVSPIPKSYPGISILSDDIGKVIGVDDCRCGRLGKYFVFEKRLEAAELKGCGDTLKI